MASRERSRGGNMGPLASVAHAEIARVAATWQLIRPPGHLPAIVTEVMPDAVEQVSGLVADVPERHAAEWIEVCGGFECEVFEPGRERAVRAAVLFERHRHARAPYGGHAGCDDACRA